MLTFNPNFAGAEAIGRVHGLDLAHCLQEMAPAVSQTVSSLFANQNKAGAWLRWLGLGADTQLLADITAYTKRVEGRFKNIVILGIGGSSLGGYALLKALLHPYWNDLTDAQRQGKPRYYFLENVDSDQVAGLLEMVSLPDTLFLVITKSGTTAETMSAFLTVQATLKASLGDANAKEHIVAITDASKGILRNIANAEGYTTFVVPDDVGGRFSVFSAVGLLPAALCGVAIDQCQQGIQDLLPLLQHTDITQNPAAQNAALQIKFYQAGKPLSVFMPYSARLAAVSDWYVQLWAESLGKKHDLNGRVVHVGPTPVRAVGVTDQHSQVQLFNEGPFDKVFTFVTVDQPDHSVTIPHVPANGMMDELAYLGGRSFQDLMQAEFVSTRGSLVRNQRPSVTLSLPKVDAYHVAQLLFFLEVQTAIAGGLLNIDPFDQPGVELAKQYTYALMGRKGYESLISEAKGEARPAVAV
jgi:glucose-6-phosphate isomerase